MGVVDESNHELVERFLGDLGGDGWVMTRNDYGVRIQGLCHDFCFFLDKWASGFVE